MSKLYRASLRSLYDEEYRALLGKGWPVHTARRIVAYRFRRQFCSKD